MTTTDKTTHTPGPWKAGGINVNLRVTGHRISDPSNVSVAFVVSGGGRSGATAALVSAAPDLLAACEAAQNVLFSVADMANDKRVHLRNQEISAIVKCGTMLENAIAKARGGK